MNGHHNGLFYFLVFMLVFQPACMWEEELTDVNIDFNEPAFQQLYDLQDRQLSDSLYAYFFHHDPSFRYAAAMAFASIKDEAAIDSLAPLLSDKVDEVRAAAAYALGQIGSHKAESWLIEAFDQFDTVGVHKNSNRAILEAVGKCATPEFLKALSTISSYQPKDTFLLEGQAWGIYRYALRNITSREGSERMAGLLSNNEFPFSVRLIAANYFSRAKDIQIDSLTTEKLAGLFTLEEDPTLRMALAIALGKSRNPEALKTLVDHYGKEQDYRVKCNILSAFGNFDYSKVQATALAALKDPNIHVAGRAALFFAEHGIPADATFYWRLAKDSLPWRVQLSLYTAANRHLPVHLEGYRNSINAELRQKYSRAKFPYEKAAAIKALGEFAWNVRYVYREAAASKMTPVKTAGMQSLLHISRLPNFRQFFGISYRRISRDLASYFKQAIESGDPALTTIAAQGLRNKDRRFENYLDSLSFLDRALAKLKLPGEVEVFNELQRTIDFFEGKSESRVEKPGFNHPIDWQVLNSLNAQQEAEIHTARGTIKLKLLPNIAPATVTNFVQLSRQGFFEGKNFHRVVPNFVIQGGCPRGDGYGGLDYTIRSELPPVHYDGEGYVGMASAGNHTECTQFFITHSPTPHLDGKYTLFAKVSKGMEVVHQIQVGDVIEKVLIK